MNRKMGFTLIEMMMTLMVLALIMFGSYTLYNTQTTSAVRALLRASELNDLRNVIETMSHDIRYSGLNANQNIWFDRLMEANDRVLKMQSDLDGDGKLLMDNEVIEYAYDASAQTLSVRRNATDTLSVILTHVSQFRIDYYTDLVDESAASTLMSVEESTRLGGAGGLEIESVEPKIQKIKITATLAVPSLIGKKGNNQVKTIPFVKTVYMRNWMY